MRLIKAPSPKLKELQSRLSGILYQCLKEIEDKKAYRPISFGFREDRSIAENAARHKRHRWVLNIDLENFFPSFNFGRVRGFFLKDKAFELHPEVATTIAQIACDGEALPQGSPCSPVISELIAQILDMKLVRLAKRMKVTYTRYADDITFSTSQKVFPKGIASQDDADSAIWHLSEGLLEIISRSGFSVNSAKTRMHFTGSRQIVTGLVVNEKVNIPSDYYRKARAMCDSLLQTGKYFKAVVAPVKEGDDSTPVLLTGTNTLEGILSHIYAVTQKEDKRDIQEQRKTPRAIRKLYRRFLFYKYFIDLKSPLIVTEGKTDPIYLKEAVRHREKFHPVLGEYDAEGFKHAVQYFNYAGQVHEILDISGGGAGNLKSILLDYRRNFRPSSKDPKRINYCPLQFPVILVVDNDDGFSQIAGPTKDIFGVAISRSDTCDFYHIIENLYIVKTPEDGANKTCIEDLFPEEWLSKELNGKKFNKNNEIDSNTEYSKEIFANSIVKKHAKEIDFSKFDDLLERVQKVIEDYAIKATTAGAKTP